MNKHIYAVGVSVLALAMSGLPAVAFADNNRGEGNSDNQTNIQTQNERSSEGRQKQEINGQRGDQSEATSSNDRGGNEVDKNQNDDGEINLDLEDEEDVASSLNDLKQKIEVRKHELEQEVASTTEADKNIVENANPVRLAVHALLASKNLVGGIGGQVSEIAKSMNDSVATTTNAEAKIQSRGFFTRLFFGGDSAAADVITQAVAQNQQRIDDITKLLGETNVSVDIQAVLSAQITALQDAQTRLQALADKEQKMWGLFSWRF